MIAFFHGENEGSKKVTSEVGDDATGEINSEVTGEVKSA